MAVSTVHSKNLVINGPEDQAIAGILTQRNPIPAPGTHLIIIVHGHGGHKDYCYQRTLAEMPNNEFDSYRFDFRGCGNSTDEFNANGKKITDVRNAAHDMDDLEAVVKYFQNTSPYKVWAIVGHSRGKLYRVCYLF